LAAQLPPSQRQLAPSAQVTEQSLVAQLTLQLAPVAQLRLHLPPGQLAVQLLPVVHMY